ncbi:MAG: carbohydrate transporter substrate-binding protein, partial [Paenibacillus sp.]|nr:carbohydrate transporter substrate-binding protein [Paenibacillus sp.]
MKKVFSLCIAAVLSIGVAGCQTSGSSKPSSLPQQSAASKSEPVKLEFMSNMSTQTLKEIQSLAEQFHKENPNITVDVSSQSADFEALIKAKMASGDLPDLWTTHGWSVERYSNFLQPLNDQAWYSSIKESFKPIITNKQGQVFV